GGGAARRAGSSGRGPGRRDLERRAAQGGALGRAGAGAGGPHVVRRSDAAAGSRSTGPRTGRRLVPALGERRPGIGGRRAAWGSPVSPRGRTRPVRRRRAGTLRRLVLSELPRVGDRG